MSGYTDWIAAGKPLTPCMPVREIVGRLKVAFPDSGPFSWYANDAHYQAATPQDHTPFSVTGWPLPSPRWYVFATDIMHKPAEGVDCHKLFAYWLAEAKAGRMPWLKYMIWQGKLYSVRNGWTPVAADGHYDHIHLSVRTDHRDTHLGAWSLTPGEDMTAAEFLALLKDPAVAAQMRAFPWQYVGGGIPAGMSTLGVFSATHTYAKAAAGALPADLAARLTAILTAANDDGDVTVTLPAEAVTMLAQLRDAVAALPDNAEVRDAVADLAEGGAAAVRADAP